MTQEKRESRQQKTLWIGALILLLLLISIFFISTSTNHSDTTTAAPQEPAVEPVAKVEPNGPTAPSPCPQQRPYRLSDQHEVTDLYRAYLAVEAILQEQPWDMLSPGVGEVESGAGAGAGIIVRGDALKIPGKDISGGMLLRPLAGMMEGDDPRTADQAEVEFQNWKVVDQSSGLQTTLHGKLSFTDWIAADKPARRMVFVGAIVQQGAKTDWSKAFDLGAEVSLQWVSFGRDEEAEIESSASIRGWCRGDLALESGRGIDPSCSKIDAGRGRASISSAEHRADLMFYDEGLCDDCGQWSTDGAPLVDFCASAVAHP